MTKTTNNHRTYKTVGQFKVNGDIYVSDPCYEKGNNWYTRKVSGVVQGTWIAEININHYQHHYGEKTYTDKRVAQLFVRADGVGRYIHNRLTVGKETIQYRMGWESLSDVAVDSGQMGIFDYNHFGDCNCFETDGKCGFGDRWYSNLCDMTLDGQAGVFEYGVNSSAGFGDGLYSLWGHKNKEGLYDAFCVVFLPDNDEIGG